MYKKFCDKLVVRPHRPAECGQAQFIHEPFTQVFVVRTKQKTYCHSMNVRPVLQVGLVLILFSFFVYGRSSWTFINEAGGLPNSHGVWVVETLLGIGLSICCWGLSPWFHGLFVGESMPRVAGAVQHQLQSGVSGGEEIVCYGALDSSSH